MIARIIQKLKEKEFLNFAAGHGGISNLIRALGRIS